MADHNLTQEYVKSCLSYDPDTGIFTSLKTFRRWKAGRIIGTYDHYGYRLISIDKKQYKAHRIAWLYVYGEFPETGIDHIDCNKDNNRITNLRVANQTINNQNVKKAKRHNACGVLGVTVEKTKKGKIRYKARIGINGKPRTIGRFSTVEEAHEAYLYVKRRLHEGCTI